ncbi:hypothetical protein EVAR_31330_1 [Eumeta japonica]|uniref:Uncharacterized protein n=1 Tax=Eumeta variegata TaxID=151549 RepID=A0A4C1XYN6_EUMVA|nr:hypothetical protein EVAR_31330_1 [Eumeta japonica]
MVPGNKSGEVVRADSQRSAQCKSTGYRDISSQLSRENGSSAPSFPVFEEPAGHSLTPMIIHMEDNECSVRRVETVGRGREWPLHLAAASRIDAFNKAILKCPPEEVETFVC